ncbi:hypothetical protein K2173_011636 [Erythroxylum novogranatense]|uniref:BHLH domain-containing protein n=1 Tax=Erythroxylum novogranatense TaxID=1862640 RepID=A0AAV8U4Z4_9ROSI|nr:hypothetical protein K2173_011636 [Erythroxylum novogranatense]
MFVLLSPLFPFLYSLLIPLLFLAHRVSSLIFLPPLFSFLGSVPVLSDIRPLRHQICIWVLNFSLIHFCSCPVSSCKVYLFFIFPMEKEKLFMNQATNGTTPMWNSSSFGMGMQSNDLGSCFFNSNWDSSMDQNDPFESALSPIVSSPLVSSANAISSHGGSGDTVMIRELIGRLGTICDSEEIFPHSSYVNNTDNINNNNNANNSCYSTPLNSPPKLNLPFMDSHIKGRIPILGNNLTNQQSLVPFPTDPVFAERAARYSCLENRNLGGLSGQFGLNQAELLYGLMPGAESGNISIVQSSNSMKVTASQGIVQESNKSSPQDVSSNSAAKRNGELGDFNEKSSVSEQIPDGEMSVKGQKEYNPRKRKSIPRGKNKETPSPSPCSSGAKVVAENNDEPSLKKGKSDEANGKQKDAGKAKEEEQDGDQKKNQDSPKPAEPLKDYIHVRARRGQATDSHSLAERVRREKIGERMKFLQDLVPGCNKVTGKAVMLDEIINYVQSLQRQVEFLSMKLATVNPSMDFNMEALLSKQIFQSRGSVPNDLYPLDSSTQAFPYGYQSRQGLPLQSGLSTNAGNQFSLKRNPCLQLPPLNGFTDASRQVPSFWEDDLHSVVQMGYGQNQQSFQGSLPAAQMKLSCNSETTLQPSS